MSRWLLSIIVLAVLSFALLAVTQKGNPFRGDTSPPPAPEAEGDIEFKKGDYRTAAAWYARIAAADASVLTAEQKSAWAFCRIKLAAEMLSPTCDSKTAAAAEKEVNEALQLSPKSDEVQKLGQTVMLLARQRQMVKPETNRPFAMADGQAIETASFVVRFKERRDVAEKVGEVAEAKRAAIFERWSGPAGAAWSPKCEIELHANSETIANHSAVRLVEGKPTERRIDLRAGDDGLLENALPRELTHVVLADLFPYTPPPKWAEEGMAVLACSTEEIDRYRRTCVKCARDGKLFTLAVLLEMKEFPTAEKITGFYCGSVSLVEYLVKQKGEKHFTTFLRDSQRYGSTSALKRQYEIESPKALQEAWLKVAIR